jgi:hypothetical protein
MVSQVSVKHLWDDLRMSEHLLIQGWRSAVSLYNYSIGMSLPLWMPLCSRSEPGP